MGCVSSQSVGGSENNAAALSAKPTDYREAEGSAVPRAKTFRRVSASDSRSRRRGSQQSVSNNNFSATRAIPSKTEISSSRSNAYGTQSNVQSPSGNHLARSSFVSESHLQTSPPQGNNFDVEEEEFEESGGNGNVATPSVAPELVLPAPISPIPESHANPNSHHHHLASASVSSKPKRRTNSKSDSTGSGIASPRNPERVAARWRERRMRLASASGHQLNETSDDEALPGSVRIDKHAPTAAVGAIDILSSQLHPQLHPPPPVTAYKLTTANAESSSDIST